jgi:hypothetical protein
MQRLELHIDTVLVDGVREDEQRPLKVERVLRKAFQLFTQKIMDSHFARKEILCDLLIERLRMPGISADTLLSERGAEQLADELFEMLVRGL